MTLSTIPTYIPIKDAAKKYGYVLVELKRLAQSGKYLSKSNLVF